ncbi:coiled-coil domain-containing protein 152-like isoform X1 [Xenopus laevis]|uniref:Coiled-coil domain-containing protein 152-like isoform X1 n=1 Tax=Xenopus laevis TaxID=8355 RepID=A0A8J1L776_XENLA|nr:coiled-coil domain-containing protein 152-like isoform X1 [Xenopus laevis]
MKKNSSVNLDQLLENYSQIEKKFAEINGKNILLEAELEKSNRMWKLSCAKETAYKEDCEVLQNVIKGLQEAVEKQCSVRDENFSLKKSMKMLEEKLQAADEDYKNKVVILKTELRTKEEECGAQIQKIHCELSAKSKLKEEEANNLLLKKDMEIAALKQQLQKREKKMQSELIKQQIEFAAKLTKIQNKNSLFHPDSGTLSKNIYRTKLQHLQEEKNKVIESLRSKIKDLEQQTSSGSDSRLKRRRL